MCGVLWIGSIQTVPVKVVVAWVLGWVAEREAGIIVDGIFLAGGRGADEEVVGIVSGGR
jgi:hypothetical protein